MKKLGELYEKEGSLHKGMFARGWAELKKRAAVQAYPDRPPEAKPVTRKVEPNLGQKPSEDGGPDYVKAGLTGLVAGSLLGPLGAVAGGAIGGQIFRKKK